MQPAYDREMGSLHNLFYRGFLGIDISKLRLIHHHMVYTHFVINIIISYKPMFTLFALLVSKDDLALICPTYLFSSRLVSFRI